MPARGTRRGNERGQMLALFAISLVSLIAMTGLVIDGGATFVQRRNQQNVADAAAMAAGYAYLSSSYSISAAEAAAQAVATRNGYTSGSNGVSLTVTVTPGANHSATAVVSLTSPHRNYFTGVVGFASWNVTTSATSIAGIPNSAYGVLPLIFNQRAWNAASTAPGTPAVFDEPGTGSEDVPQDASTFNWTVFCIANGSPCNGDSSTVDSIINTNGTTTTVDINEEIGPLDAGAHTTLFSDLALRAGRSYPVAIVDDSGALLGWAFFHLTGSVGGSTKQISGYFDSTFNASPMKLDPHGGVGSSQFGAWSVYLID